ncbi:Nif3-like dinuclear metal center hexameric protein [Allobranchiibius huperziae]|uniref:GTP cyclohydrolase 1 type 2 homolog n=1 Tax=Allobranchiibius huperziae TaxID=1874116 RepID=A0A853DEF5_9MICO|nr:Nif3-like dinuclear metal center hexameric protein [Allobranchiibius huperziae]NYJ74359.1 dinuclear metal center YbgI/SA1388 family protein [Allobranchiibius huperziae]
MTTSAHDMSLAQVVAVLDGFYPPETAASWDQVGLVTGDPAQPVRRVHFAVDPTRAVVDEAVEAGADLLVTHHPLLLRGVHSVATTTAKGAVVTTAVVADLAIYCAHTNADIARPGVNDALAAAAGLSDDCAPLGMEDGQPIGRVGRLPEAVTLREFATRLADALPATPVGLRVAGDPSALVQTVAVMGGAGDDRFDDVRAHGADVYVTADLRHHPALEAREEAGDGPPYLIDAGHYATEHLWLAAAASRLAEALQARIVTHVSDLRTDPWDFTVGRPTPDRTPQYSRSSHES